jgi:hypothetical protein
MKREEFSCRAKEAAELAMQPVLQEIRERLREDMAARHEKTDLISLLMPSRS